MRLGVISHYFVLFGVCAIMCVFALLYQCLFSDVGKNHPGILDVKTTSYLQNYCSFGITIMFNLVVGFCWDYWYNLLVLAAERWVFYWFIYLYCFKIYWFIRYLWGVLIIGLQRLWLFVSMYCLGCCCLCLQRTWALIPLISPWLYGLVWFCWGCFYLWNIHGRNLLFDLGVLACASTPLLIGCQHCELYTFDGQNLLERDFTLQCLAFLGFTRCVILVWRSNFNTALTTGAFTGKCVIR